MTAKLSRRDMLKYTAGLTAGAVLAGCAPAATQAPVVEPTKAPEPVKEEPTKAPEATKAAEPEPTTEPAKVIEGKVVVMHFLHEFTEDHKKAFEAEHPGVTVEVVDGTDLTRFYAMYAAGTPPDLVRIQAPSVPQFLARKLLYDLTPYFQTSPLLKIDDLMPANYLYFAESPLQIGTGKIYGMVKDFSPDLTLFANKELFDAAGVTLDDTKSYSYMEVADMARKVIKTEGDRMLTFGYAYEGGWIDRYWMVSLAEKEMSLYSESYDKMMLTSNEEAKAIAKYYYDIMKDKTTYSVLNPSPGGWMGTDFTAGQLGFCQYGFWYSAMAEGDNTKGKLMLLPSPNWAGVHKDPTITATGMIQTAASQNPDAAWAVFEYYNGGQPSVDRAKSGWGVPGLKSQQAMIPQETDFQKQCYKVLQGELALNDKPLQFNPFLGETVVQAAVAKYMELALKDQMTFDDMLKSVEDETNAAIQDGIAAIMG